MFSGKPFYMLQCDFCYMISPEMFAEFVLPELAESCRRLDRSFYHLDGKGELPHLPQLLSIPELGGIQWVPGAGETPYYEWIDVYRAVADAGKRTPSAAPSCSSCAAASVPSASRSCAISCAAIPSRPQSDPAPPPRRTIAGEKPNTLRNTREK